ncbi:hypothetical protein AT864_02239 [Anoxybacillus sp. P3H1B]|jgi:hypothetical protein|nr:hypothetical protein AT864_02239 [Anoxybacillus sp. P3H1B]MBB3908870.1 hypothetical protein [Anoxybacillus rupiensis]
MTAQLVKMAAVRRVHEKIHAESADSRLYGRPPTVYLSIVKKRGSVLTEPSVFSKAVFIVSIKHHGKKGALHSSLFIFALFFLLFCLRNYCSRILFDRLA